MGRTRIKICGLTRAEDVKAAVAAGADAVGFVFARSPREVDIERAAELSELVPLPVARIGVFVDAAAAFVDEAVQEVGLDAVQFCGDESPSVCEASPVPVLKVLHVGDGFSWRAAEPYRDVVEAFVLDTSVPGHRGGSGRTFDWEAVPPAPPWARVWLAGGLDARNVARCVRSMRPFAVDVSSGVEAGPGMKDRVLMDAFISAVRGADSEVVR